MRFEWTQSSIQDLHQLVDAAVREGYTKRDAFLAYAIKQDNEVSDRSAATVYYREKGQQESLEQRDLTDQERETLQEVKTRQPTEVTVKRERMTWSDDQVFELLKFVTGAELAGHTKQQAFEAYRDKMNLDREVTSIATLYYRRKDDLEPQLDELPLEEFDLSDDDLKLLANLESDKKQQKPSPAPAQPEEAGESEESLEAAESTAETKTDITIEADAGTDALSVLSEEFLTQSMALAVQGVTKLMVESVALREENRVLHEKIETMQTTLLGLTSDVKKEVDDIRKNVEKQKDRFALLDHLATEFSQLRTLDCISALKDFRQQFRTYTDEYGTVTKVTDQWLEEFEKQVGKRIGQMDDNGMLPEFFQEDESEKRT